MASDNSSLALLKINDAVKFQLFTTIDNPRRLEMREPGDLKILFGDELYAIFDRQKQEILRDLKMLGNKFHPHFIQHNLYVSDLTCCLEQYYVNLVVAKTVRSL